MSIKQCVANVRAFLRAVDDALDDAYCVRLYDRAKAVDDGNYISHEELKRELGLLDCAQSDKQ
ncbi:MAG: hypothetical protein LBN04_01040 [Oscillospiraceae bacterium]|jgi:hypothetical protein|nr:hypothetical protein [Oscillospiraceae bacterium]